MRLLNCFGFDLLFFMQVESMFNLADIYGDPQLDPTRQEYILVYVAGVLARDRKARRSAEFRSRLGDKKSAGEALVKHAWNKAQLVSLAESSLERGASLSTSEIAKSAASATKRCVSQKLLREGRFQGRLLGEYTVDKIVDQSECDDGEVEYLVVWAGYDHPNEHTWEPKEVVADTEALDSWEARASSVR